MGARGSDRFEFEMPAPGVVEEPAPDGADGLASKALNLIADRHGKLWGRGKLGDLAAVGSVRVLACWSATRFTVRERRWVEDVNRPDRNERLPRQTVKTTDEVDVASYTFFETDADEGHEPVDVEGSARQVSCNDCKRGKVACDLCDGAGGTECGYCDGTGRRECDDCLGSGRVEGQRGTKNCPNCRGKGEATCGFCSRGKVKCDYCEGSGKKDCLSCEGRGKAIQVMVVRAERELAETTEEVAHPDLLPLLKRARRPKLEFSVRTAPGEEPTVMDADGFYSFLESLADTFEDTLADDSLAALLPFDRDTLLDRLAHARGLVALQDATGRVALPTEFPWPPLRDDLDFAVTGDGHLGAPSAPRFEDQIDSAQFNLVGLRVLDGAVAGCNGRVLPENIATKLAESIDKLAKAGARPKGKGTVVRDYLVVCGRAWPVVDYQIDSKRYRAFVGPEQIHCPEASPLADEPDRLVADARTALADGRHDDAVEAVRRAVAHEILWPDPEPLASLLTSLPKDKDVPKQAKLAIVDAIGDALKRRTAEPHPVFAWTPGRVNEALVKSVRASVASAGSWLVAAIVLGVLAAVGAAFYFTMGT